MRLLNPSLALLCLLSCVETALVGQSSGSPPKIYKVVDGAAFIRHSASQGGWFTILGVNLPSTTRIWSQADFNGSAMPTEVDGTSVPAF